MLYSIMPNFEANLVLMFKFRGVKQQLWDKLNDLKSVSTLKVHTVYTFKS